MLSNSNFFRDIKNIVILTLTILFIIRSLQVDIRFVAYTLIGVTIAIILDLAIHYITQHQFFIPKSAIISGLIVTGIVSYQEPFWVIILLTSIAILSKHIIKINKRHFLNPANTALTTATLLHIPLTWTLESNIYILILAGIYFTYRLKKWGHVIGFIITFSVCLLLNRVNPLFMLSWFFIFIMLIEPKTSGNGFVRGLIFGVTAGIVAFLGFKFFPQYDFLVISLFAVNLLNPIFDYFFFKGKPKMFVV